MAIDLRLRGKFDMFRKHKYWLICAVIGAAAVVSLKLARRDHAPANIASGDRAPALPGIVEGRLRVSAFGAGLSGSQFNVERGPGAGLWLVLYGLKKDYSPGQGGKEHDNVSSAASMDTKRSTLFVRA